MDVALAGGSVQGLLDFDEPFAGSNLIGLGQCSFKGLHRSANHTFVGLVRQAAGQILAYTFFGRSGIGQGAHLSLSYCFTTEKETSKLPHDLSSEALERRPKIPYIEGQC